MATMIVDTMKLRIRVTPSTASPSLGFVFRNEEVNVLEEKTTDITWAKIDKPLQGWVPRSLLRKFSW